MPKYRGRRTSISFGERRQRGVIGRIVTASVTLALLGAIGFVIWLTHFAMTLPADFGRAPRIFNIDQGLGVRQIAQRLEKLKLVSSADGFVILVRALGQSGDIKAGSYEVDSPLSPLDLLDKLTRGQFAQGQIRFIEGTTFRELRSALDAHPGIRHDTKGLSAAALLARLNIPEKHPEGLFFPDTYHFAAGTSDLTILQQSYEKLQAVLGSLWEGRAHNLPFRSSYEALVLASIVEKETGHPEERNLVAAVFVNRLRRGMRLQADPTVIYGLGETFDGNLRKRDLLADQPYNSYTRYGLPPTPIALPGQAAIAATLNPAKSKALYFVGRGDGTHHFSDSLAEHNRAVNQFQRLRR